MPLRIRSHITYPPPDEQESETEQADVSYSPARVFKIWTAKEKAIVRKYYKPLGSHATAEMLPGRTPRAIQNCARVLGVSGYGK